MLAKLDPMFPEVTGRSLKLSTRLLFSSANSAMGRDVSGTPAEIERTKNKFKPYLLPRMTQRLNLLKICFYNFQIS